MSPWMDIPSFTESLCANKEWTLDWQLVDIGWPQDIISPLGYYYWYLLSDGYLLMSLIISWVQKSPWGSIQYHVICPKQSWAAKELYLVMKQVVWKLIAIAPWMSSEFKCWLFIRAIIDVSGLTNLGSCLLSCVFDNRLSLLHFCAGELYSNWMQASLSWDINAIYY